jgi:hypothetical protein
VFDSRQKYADTFLFFLGAIGVQMEICSPRRAMKQGLWKPAHSRGQTRVVQICDKYGKIYYHPFSWKVLLAINWSQKAFRIKMDGTVVAQG